MLLDATVIIPTAGRRPDLLRRALASVWSQTVEPAATLVIVDGDEARRTDVARHCTGYGEVQVLALGQNEGVSAARNFGAARARSRFLCFLDDDDVWKPSYLAQAFSAGVDFDVALTAFEKHNAEGVRPEKVPPPSLEESHFRVANPGLRGSNLIVTRETFARVGGFDVGLPSFNDLDFGLRLARLNGLRYRRIVEPLVEYHAHSGMRLSNRGATTIAPGLQGFLERHASSMTPQEYVAFRERAVDLWSVDPWASPTHLRDSLRRLESQLLEASLVSDARVDAVQSEIDRLCSNRRTSHRLERVRVAIITVEPPGHAERLLSSLLAEATRSHFMADACAPWLDALVLENAPSDGAPVYLGSDPRLRVIRRRLADDRQRLATSRARALAFEHVLSMGWEPSATSPVWFLDEDLRFEVLLPSRSWGYRLSPGGALLHRMADVVADAAADGIAVLVGEVSMSAPVPAVGLLERQLKDLWQGAASSDPWAELWRRDSYYDLSLHASSESVPWRAAWWRDDRQWRWSDVAERLRVGLPVSRAALPSLERTAFPAPTVAGGNTLILHRDALRPDLFVSTQRDGVTSRRGDSIWCVRLQRAGVRAASIPLSLAHHRTPAGRLGTDALIRDALADIDGVGLQRAWSERDDPPPELVESHRRDRLLAVLARLEAALRCVQRPRPDDMPGAFQDDMADFLAELLRRLSS